jgi:hypothetical protein
MQITSKKTIRILEPIETLAVSTSDDR